jgi:catalase
MDKMLATALGIPVDDNWNIAAAGKRSPALRQNIWFVNKMAIFDREVISERSMHARVDGGSTNLKEVVYAEVRR